MISAMNNAALAISSWMELSILVKVTLMLILGLCIARLAHRAQASVRHLVLAVTFASLGFIPLMTAVLPEVTIPVPVTRADSDLPSTSSVHTTTGVARNTTIPNGSQTVNEDSQFVPSWPLMFRLAWIAGALLVLALLALDVWRLRRLRQTALPSLALSNLVQSLATESGIRKRIDVLVHEDVAAPLTCGVLRPAIVLPSDAQEWGESDLHRALVHELEHVRRGDWGMQLLARVSCAAYWFHPLVWQARRQLCLEAERACDDAVIQNAKPTDYAEQLVLLARKLSSSYSQPALGMADRRDLTTRVSALLDGSQRRGRAGLAAITSALALAGFIVASVAPLRTVASTVASGQSNVLVTRGSDGQARTNLERRQVEISQLDEALYKAAAFGNVADVEKLLNAGANINVKLEGDGTPLIAAAREGRTAVVRFLLDRGADPNLAVPGDGNPLIMAAREGRVDIVVLLLDRGAVIDMMVPGDENALIQASAQGNFEMVKLLVSRGANVNVRAWSEGSLDRAGEWRTPLSVAQKEGHRLVVEYLLSLGAQK